MTTQAKESTPKRATPRPLTNGGMVTTATAIGDNCPSRFHRVLPASKRPAVRLGTVRAVLIGNHALLHKISSIIRKRPIPAPGRQPVTLEMRGPIKGTL